MRKWQLTGIIPIAQVNPGTRRRFSGGAVPHGEEGLLGFGFVFVVRRPVLWFNNDSKKEGRGGVCEKERKVGCLKSLSLESHEWRMPEGVERMMRPNVSKCQASQAPWPCSRWHIHIRNRKQDVEGQEWIWTAWTV